MSCTSPRTVASTMRPLPPEPSTRSRWGSRWATEIFMVSADCSTNGSCISPLPKSSPTSFMPSSRTSLMMESGSMPSAIARSRSSVRASRSPSMMRWRSSSEMVQPERSSVTVSVACTSSKMLRSVVSGSYFASPPESVPAAPRRSQTRSRQTSRCSSGMRLSGRILAACTMAESRPTCTHSCRNTLLSTWRAAGLRPNDTLERPSVVCTPGSSDLMRRMASMVAMPSPRRSSSPVDSGKVSASKIRSCGSRP